MHALASIQHIKEKIPEPWKMALIERAIEKGVTYKLKCVNTGTVTRPTDEVDEKTGKPVMKKFRRRYLKTKFSGVERTFEKGTEMEVPAAVASFLWDKYNVNMVGGSIRHESTTDAPFDAPCFEEIVDAERSDLGPDVTLRSGGVAAQEDLLQEKRGPADRGGRAASDEVTDEEIAQVSRSTGARPAGGSGV